MTKAKRAMRWNIHPGEVLREEFLKPLNLTAYGLAKRLRVPVPRVNDILLGKRGVSADTAVRLAQFFGTSTQFWMNLQASFEIRRAKARLARDIRRIQPWRTGRAA